MAGKGIGMLVAFISVPLTVRYLGAERYGVWMAISSMLVWLSLADLGFGNNLTNAVSASYSRDAKSEAQAHVATTFWSLLVTSLALMVILLVLWTLLDWPSLFGVHSPVARAETAPAVAVAIIITMLGIPLSIIDKTLNAYQEGAISNAWLTAANIMSLVGLIVVTQFDGGLVWLIISFSGVALLVRALNGIWLFGFHKPWLRPRLRAFDRSLLRPTLSTSGMFFIIQLGSLVLFQTDNLVIAHYLGASAVTPYSVTYRLFAYTVLLQTISFPYLWPAFSEAYTRRDIGWIQRTLRLMLTGGLAITLVLLALLLLFGQQIITLWAGKEAVPEFALLVWMAIWNLILAIMNPVSCLLNASGRLKGLVIYGAVTAAVNLGLSIYLAQRVGTVGVVIATVVSYCIFNMLPQLIETRLMLKKLAASEPALEPSLP